MSDIATAFDALIVGAGPGGIAATVSAAEAGLRVGLIDEGTFAGGQIWRNHGDRPGTSTARRWLARLDAVATRITWLRQSRVIDAPAPGTLLAETPEGPRSLRWKSLVLATGARELFLPFPGWTLPGVIGAGGIQALVKQGLPIRGKRIVLAGTGPLLLAVARLLKSKGAVVGLIMEQASRARINRLALSLLRSPSKLLEGISLRSRLLGIRYATDSFPTRVSSASPGLRVEYRSGRRDESIDCDWLACGFGLIPNTELAQLLDCKTTPDGFVRVDNRLRTSVPNIYAVGELTGIGGANKAVIEGMIAAHAIAGNESRDSALARTHASHLHFVGRLSDAFALRPELRTLAKSDTLVCRCEDVPFSAIAQMPSGRDAKLQTRCGMGACQGRICGPILQHLIGAEPPQVRAPIFPATVAALAASPRRL